VMVTTDKVYRNCETGTPFAEDDPLGGHDPYSSSKAAMEIAVASWRASFFSKDGPWIAAARAGNVIGGGDWSADRIVPDLARALAGNAVPELRHPGALRPWQHVIEPLAGYLQLGVRLAGTSGADHAEAWNLGPDPDQARSVGDLTEALLNAWGRPGWVRSDNRETPHEAGLLRLAIGKACDRLGWAPVWDFAATVQRTAQWYRTVLDDPDAARNACLADIDAYCSAAISKDLGLAR
jgi:CDP-glucose 4,6-dehydratase